MLRDRILKYAINASYIIVGYCKFQFRENIYGKRYISRNISKSSFLTRVYDSTKKKWMTNIVSGTEYFLLNFSKDQRGTRYRRRVIFRRIVNYRKSRSFIARSLPPSHPFVRSLLLLPRTWHTSHPLNRRLGPRLKSFFISRVLFWLVTLQKWGMSSRGRQAGTHREGEKKKKNSMGNDFPITSYNYGIATRLITINRCLKRGGGGFVSFNLPISARGIRLNCFWNFSF